jgi:hypothetical protein
MEVTITSEPPHFIEPLTVLKAPFGITTSFRFPFVRDPSLGTTNITCTLQNNKSLPSFIKSIDSYLEVMPSEKADLGPHELTVTLMNTCGIRTEYNMTVKVSTAPTGQNSSSERSNKSLEKEKRSQSEKT